MPKDAATRAELERLIDQATELSRDYGVEVAEAVRLATGQPLDADTATRLYTRILELIRGVDATADAATRRRLAAKVRREVEALVSAVRRPSSSGRRAGRDRSERRGGLTFFEKNGLTPHNVAPTPIFNDLQIPMWEGYVDVNDLPLWPENHRVELYVREFIERNRREPDDDELLQLLHGSLDDLPSIRGTTDPFDIVPLANSIARKGVERPPIVTWDGTPKDGNRRIAASKYVLASDRYDASQRERARWIRVWQAPEGTTEDQFETMVMALNFEDDHKEPWPEYVKGRLVVARYRERRDDHRGMLTESQAKRLREDVAKAFAITAPEVLRYQRMVNWAEDFESYHVLERGMDPAQVRYKANDIFQYFYEMQAGRAGDKLTVQLDKDEGLRPVVYDLMYDVITSGAQVRDLHRVVADEAALKLLEQAHDEANSSRVDQAHAYLNEAIAEAKRKGPTKKLGFEQWVRGAVDRLGAASPEDWAKVDTGLLAQLRKLLPAANGAIEGELTGRGLKVPSVEDVVGA